MNDNQNILVNTKNELFTGCYKLKPTQFLQAKPLGLLGAVLLLM